MSISDLKYKVDNIEPFQEKITQKIEEINKDLITNINDTSILDKKLISMQKTFDSNDNKISTFINSNETNIQFQMNEL